MRLRLKLSTRLILGISLIVALMLSLLLWNSFSLISSSQTELLKQSIDDQANLLAISLEPGLERNDQHLLNNTLSLLRDNPNIIYTIVYDKHKNVVTSLERKPFPAERNADQSNIGLATTVNLQRDITYAGQHLGEVHIGYSIANIKQSIRAIQIENSAIALAALLLTILLTALISLYFTRGLRWLEEGVQALERNDLSYRIPFISKDEIGNIALSFNKLAEHLHSAQFSLNQDHHILAQEKQRMETLLNGINAVILEIDPLSKRILYVSQEAEKLLGYPRGAWLEDNFWRHHLHPDDYDWVVNTINQQIEETGDFSLDYRLRHQDGEYIWIRSIHTFGYDADRQLHYRGLFIDINQQKKAEQHIIYLANHDSLTGLYNRHCFQEQLTHQISYAVRFKFQGALLFLDLDQFKYINDTLGHQSGDECLISAAHTLASSLREVDIIGRLGGDEFGVILQRTDAKGAEKVAELLLQKLAEQLAVPEGLSISIRASIGITLFPEHGKTASELLAKADAAMYTAKRNGRNQAHVYCEEDKELLNMQTKIHWESRIRKALEHDLFTLHYQPIIDLQTNQIAHYEVLLRMQDEDNKLIYPTDFLDIAERFGLISEIDKWVLSKAIKTQGESRNTANPVTLAVNLSGRHFGNPEFVHLVKEAITAHNADPHSLIIEVTETAAVENFAQARSFIESLRGLGCRIALDDFGMGYSSFHYLKNLPVDMVKIDGNFVRNLHENHSDQVIVKAMSELARGMKIHTVAEFVENERIKSLLKNFGVTYGQGYHIARPHPEFLPSLA